jgi:hypothetical protein
MGYVRRHERTIWPVSEEEREKTYPSEGGTIFEEDL